MWYWWRLQRSLIRMTVVLCGRLLHAGEVTVSKLRELGVETVGQFRQLVQEGDADEVRMMKTVSCPLACWLPNFHLRAVFLLCCLFPPANTSYRHLLQCASTADCCVVLWRLCPRLPIRSCATC